MAESNAQDHATAYCELLKCLADIGYEPADGVLQEVPCDIDDIKPGGGCNESESNQGAKAGGDIAMVLLLLAMLMQRSRGRRRSVD